MARQTRAQVKAEASSAGNMLRSSLPVVSKAAASKAAQAKSTTSLVNSAAKRTAASSAEAKAPAKKRKIETPPLPTPAAASTSTTAAHTPLSLLPPTMTFSLPDAISHLSAHDPRFGQFFAQIPCKPFQEPLDAIDPFKTLVTSIIGQQVSWMAARAINKRFKALFGYTEPEDGGEGSDGFPSPAEVAKEEVLRLKGVGLSMRKAEYVICLAQHFEDGRLSTELLRDGTDEEVAKALIAVRGIGQWTVDMFLMFSLRRPDVLPVGDLGVQKGLLRWILAAHGHLPKSKSGKSSAEAKKKYGLTKEVVKDEVAPDGSGEIDTTVAGPRPSTPRRQNGTLPPTPLSPNGTSHPAVLHTPGQTSAPMVPPTPGSPGPSKPAETLETSGKDLPPPAPETLLHPPLDDPKWDANASAPLPEGLSIELLKSRLSGKKAKGGAYLTPQEMEVLTEGWRPYRSLATYYMWPAGEEF